MALKLVGDGPLPTAKLNDIPAMLRHIAQTMEELAPEERPDTVLTVDVYGDGRVRLGCLGDNPGKFQIVGALELAKRLFSPDASAVGRSSDFD